MVEAIANDDHIGAVAVVTWLFAGTQELVRKTFVFGEEVVLFKSFFFSPCSLLSSMSMSVFFFGVVVYSSVRRAIAASLTRHRSRRAVAAARRPAVHEPLVRGGLLRAHVEAPRGLGAERRLHAAHVAHAQAADLGEP